MKIAYFNMSCGASGDMILAALLDAGLSWAWLKKVIRDIGLRGVYPVITRVEKNHLPALSVAFKGGKPLMLSHMRSMIHQSSFSTGIKKNATAILNWLITAETCVHHNYLKKNHFHQLAEPDTIIDIVAVCAAIEALHIQHIIGSPINAGALAPATAYILKKIKAPVCTDTQSVSCERITPTGAALCAGLSMTFGGMPLMRIEQAGFGAGEKIFPHNNCLTMIIGEGDIIPQPDQTDVLCIETNIDDMDSRVYPYVMDALFAAGALDVWMTPVHMKKGRPGIMLSVLCSAHTFDAVKSILFSETTTWGIRWHSMQRSCLPRWKKGIMKCGMWHNTIKKNVEFSDAVKIAKKNKKPLFQILKMKQ